jgi:hypothetical protein
LGGDNLKEAFKMTCTVLLVVAIICAMAIGLVLGFSLLLSLFLPQSIALVGGIVLGIFTFTFVIILFDQKYEENN